MKIGIIYYSETGHTLQACEALKTKFEELGHSVDLKAVTVIDIKTDKTLKDCPEVLNYDLIIFGTPVQGFSLPIPMAEYLKKIHLPLNQKIGVLITQYFKVSWLGANHTIRQLLNAIEISKPDLYAYSIIHWSSKRRLDQLTKAIDKFANIA